MPELESIPPFERPAHLARFADRIPAYSDKIAAKPDAVVVHLRELPAVVEHLEQQ